ncbi:MAG: hypothetical protein WD468_00390 [Pirellulales bacterium]
MNHRDSNKLKRSVRLFPRLATTNLTTQASLRRARLAARAASAVANTDPIASARAQVKARLLQMILDSEQVRRNERRPNHA